MCMCMCMYIYVVQRLCSAAVSLWGCGGLMLFQPRPIQVSVGTLDTSRSCIASKVTTLTRIPGSGPIPVIVGTFETKITTLTHGRFTSVILTRNVAETVLLSQIQKRLREDNIDVDATIEAIYKFKNLKPPDKVKEATNFVTPLVEEIFLAMKPWTQVKHYGKNFEQDNQVMQELEEEAAKYKQRLKSAGMEVTPTKVLPLQAPPPTRSDSQQTPSPQHEAPPRGALPDNPHEDPPSKRRRTQRGDRKKQYETMLEEPFNVIKQSGQQPPTSMTSIKTWVTNLKKTMPADKHKDLDQHIQQVQPLLDEGKYTKVQLQEMATKTHRFATSDPPTSPWPRESTTESPR